MPGGMTGIIFVKTDNVPKVMAHIGEIARNLRGVFFTSSHSARLEEPIQRISSPPRCSPTR